MNPHPTLPRSSIEYSAELLERVSRWLTNAPAHVLDHLDNYLADDGGDSDGLIDALDYNAYRLRRRLDTDPQSRLSI